MIYIIFILISLNNLYKYNQIMQQQYYSIDRYIKVLNKQNDVYDFVIFLLGVIVFITNNVIFYNIYLLLLLSYYFPRKRKEIIKLKITKRIVRMYIFQALFIFLCAFLTNMLVFELKAIVLGGYCFLFKYLYLLSFGLENIIELLIKRKYVKLAKRKLRIYKPKIIAITGSFGKTSTKEYLKTILSKKYNVIATPKSYNTIMGITSFINNSLNKEYDYIILEVGVDSKNGMNKFLKLFTPDISIVTGLAPQHLSTFKTIENIANEKMKLAFAAKEKAFINGDFELYVKQNKKFIYCKTKEIKIKDEGFIYDEDYYQTNLFGEHLYINLLLVIKVSLHLNLSEKLIKDGIKNIVNSPHRFELIKLEKTLVIDDSYNSNLYSFEKALDSLSKIDKYKIIITPGLIELGDKSYEYNSIVAKKCEEICDKIFLVGNNSAFKENLKSSEKLETFLNFKDAYHKALLIELDKAILIENDLPDIFIE